MVALPPPPPPPLPLSSTRVIITRMPTSAPPSDIALRRSWRARGRGSGGGGRRLEGPRKGLRWMGEEATAADAAASSDHARHLERRAELELAGERADWMDREAEVQTCPEEDLLFGKCGVAQNNPSNDECTMDERESIPEQESHDSSSHGSNTEANTDNIFLGGQ